MNLSALNNLTPYTVNNSLINDTTQIGSNLVSNANTSTDGYFGLAILIVIFIFLIIILMSEGEVFRFAFLDALIVSSGMVTILGITLLVGNLISSFQHVILFAIVFLIAIVSKYYKNER